MGRYEKSRASNANKPPSTSSSYNMTSMRDFEALDQLFASTAVDDSKPLKQEKTHYGVDGPVKVTGPSPGSIGPAKKAAPKKAKAKRATKAKKAKKAKKA